MDVMVGTSKQMGCKQTGKTWLSKRNESGGMSAVYRFAGRSWFNDGN